MKGTLNYYTSDPEFINSIEGWVILPLERKDSTSYLLSEDTDRQVKDRFKKGLIKDGDEVEFEFVTDCSVDHVTFS
jgi:hypothetical protein